MKKYKKQKFLIQGQALSVNKFYQQRHWSIRKKLVDEWHELVFYAVKQYKIKKVVNYPIKVEAVFYLKRSIDIDNCTLKTIIDGLRYAYILEEDSIKYINEINKKTFLDKENPRMEITLIEYVN